MRKVRSCSLWTEEEEKILEDLERVHLFWKLTCSSEHRETNNRICHPRDYSFQARDSQPGGPRFKNACGSPEIVGIAVKRGGELCVFFWGGECETDQQQMFSLCYRKQTLHEKSKERSKGSKKQPTTRPILICIWSKCCFLKPVE